MVTGKSGKGGAEPLLDFSLAHLFFFLMKLSIGLLAGALLILYWPTSDARLSYMVSLDVGARTALTSAQDPTSHKNIVVPVVGSTLPRAFSVSDEIVSDASADVGGTDAAINQSCSEPCLIARRLIDHLVNLSDEEAEAILATAHRLANAVRQNAELRYGLLRIANSLSSAQRQLLINAFYLLEPEHRRMLGVVLDRSPDPIQRLDGIQLMASANVLDAAIVNRLSGRVVEEPDVLVREALVRALNQPELLRGNPRVLEALQQMKLIEQDDAVRGQALLAQASLSVNPEAFIEDSITAIRSGQDVYAFDGALALERILVQVSRNEAPLSAENKAAMHNLMEDLMTSKSMEAIPKALRVSLDDLYERFF